MRSIYLTSCDPLVLNLSLNLWKNNWHDQVDMLYIAFNNKANIKEEIIYELMRIWIQDSRIRFIYSPFGLDPNAALKQCLFNSKEDLVMLMEDDCFIASNVKIGLYFKIIESGITDMVGSLRYGIGEIADAAKVKYNLNYSGLGDRGYGFWPNMFFCKKQDLLKTDLNFGSKKFNKGEYYKELDHTFTDDCYADTFAWMSIQLRYFNLSSTDITQNHCHPYDLEYSKTQQGMFASSRPDYVHAGSLSSGIGGYLNDALPDVSTDINIQDIETRAAWWTMACENIHSHLDQDFVKNYNLGIDKLVNKAGLNRSRINDKIMLYKSILNL